jgi:hypothetical protein
MKTAICACGCHMPYDEAVRATMRTSLLNQDQAEAVVDKMWVQPIEDIKPDTQIRLEDEDEFVTVDYVAERFYEPGVFNLWIVGDKLPTRFERGDLVEVQE